MKKSLLALAVTMALGGCSLVPELRMPELPVAARFEGQPAARPAPAPIHWQTFFQDAELRALIDTALRNNRDLRVAALNLQAYQALYRIQRAALLPQVSADGNASRTRVPGDLSQSGQPTTSGQYTATLGVSWELDLFGRLRSLSDQALEEYLASDAAMQSTRISLIAGVANSWLNWQANHALLELTRETLQAYENSLSLTQRSFDVGVATALELAQARTAVETARAAQAQYSRAVAQERNALELLLGQPLAASPAPADLVGARRLLADFPVGLPSDLLLQRPDIVQAEHLLRAANASIGAARAAFFPSIGLTGAAGTASAELSGLFKGGSGYWSFQPSINVPIFTAGRLKANLDYAALSRDAQVAQYERSIQSAFREVSDGLAARATYEDQVRAQRAMVEASQDYLRLAERRYRAGVDSYLVLLDAQRQLFSAQQQLIGDLLAQQVSEVDLFKALGGGWQAAPAAPAG